MLYAKRKPFRLCKASSARINQGNAQSAEIVGEQTNNAIKNMSNMYMQLNSSNIVLYIALAGIIGYVITKSNKK